MAVKNTFPGLINPKEQTAQFVNIKKEISYHPVDNGIVIIRVIKGWKRFMKKVPDKMTETYHIPENRVYLYPSGLRDGILTPEKNIFLCGVREECHKDLIQKNDELKLRISAIIRQRDKYKKDKEDAEKELKDVQRQMAMLK